LNWGRIVAIVSLMLVGAVGTYELKAHAQQELPTPCSINVPAEWGDFKGMSKTGMIFEDKNGTLRIISEIPCNLDRGIVSTPRVLVEIHRR
jgi:hypothetical protein